MPQAQAGSVIPPHAQAGSVIRRFFTRGPLVMDQLEAVAGGLLTIPKSMSFAMEILPNKHRIPGTRGANVYLLLDNTLILVDTGMPGSADTILNYIEALDRTNLERIR
jgi:hypothetical protein